MKVILTCMPTSPCTTGFSWPTETDPKYTDAGLADSLRSAPPPRCARGPGDGNPDDGAGLADAKQRPDRNGAEVDGVDPRAVIERFCCPAG